MQYEIINLYSQNKKIEKRANRDMVLAGLILPLTVIVYCLIEHYKLIG